MALEDDFKQAQDRVKTLKSAPPNETLLDLYALFKQGNQGDVSGKRPGMLDIKGRAKYDAWSKRKGMNKDKAMEEYVALVNRLAGS